MSLPPAIKSINPPLPYNLNNATINLLTPFVPTQLSNLALWLDSADSIQFSYSSGSNISQWNDKSQNNFHAIPNATSNAPVNTASGVLFSNQNSGAGGIIQGFTTTYTGSSFESFFIVMNPVNLSQDSVFIYGNNSKARVGFIDTISNIIVSSNGLSSRVVSGGLVVLNNITLVDILFNDGTKLNNYVNGLDSASKTSFQPFFQPATTTIGTDNYIGSNSFNGYINEILIYSNILSDNDRQKVESYLAWKWGPILDPSNPYYQSPYSNYLYPFINSNILLSSRVSINTYSRFIPTNLSNLALWLDSADASTFSYFSGSNISQWNDKSQNNFHATPAATSNAPVNTASGVSFTNTGPGGTIQTLSNSYIGLSDPLYSESIFIVLASSNTTNIFTLLQGTSDDTRLLYIGSSSNFVSANVNGIAPITILSAGTVSNNKPTIVNSIFNNNINVNHYINGTNVGTGSSYSIGIGGPTLIGCDLYGSNGYNGFINEILIYSNALSAADRQQVETYLSIKWNIPLDTTNQYYTNSLVPNEYRLISNFFNPPYIMQNKPFF